MNTISCPKCQNPMHALEVDDVRVSKCGSCSGLWFKGGTHKQAKHSAELLDQVESNAAAAYNPQREIDCPECGQRLMKMTDPEQLHIKFEACSDCDAVFFDSGEFQDYSEFTVSERLRQIVDTVKTNLK